jgi:hypothetical protein
LYYLRGRGSLRGNAMTNRSTECFAELQKVLARIRDLNAEADANQPIRRTYRLSDAENQENFRRSARLALIGIELDKLNPKAAQLRKDHANALEAERQPPVAGPSKALQALYRQRDELAARLGDLLEERSKHALSGVEGDKKAKAALALAVDDHAAVEIELQNINLAIKQAEARDAEVKFEFSNRDADEKHRAGLVAADAIVVWAEDFDVKLQAIAEHFAKLPDLQKALAKSGASINTDLTSRIYTAASRDRAAKSANLHRVFSIDATVDAVPLGDAFKSLLRAAVRRPDIGRKIAS